jgi:CofH subfamily radical SAM domain protein
MDSKVILETVLHREEITAIEALMLMREDQKILPELCRVADTLNQRVNRSNVTFVKSKQISYTNVCRAECSFCSFWRKKGQKGAFTLEPEDVVRQVREAWPVKQVVLSGGLNPDLTLPYHLENIRAVREAYPSVHIHGYSPSEIHFLARRSRMPSAEILRRFKDAGLDSLSGDSADILNDKLRKKICSDKLRTADWADVIKTAHKLGMTTTATILFGHVEDEIYICEHLEIIKNIQRETGGFTAFEPQAFVPHGTDLARSAKIKGAVEPERVLQMVAIARIFLGRLIKHISIDWTKTGLDLALKCLSAGANDLGALSYDPFEIRLPEINGKGGFTAPALRQAIQKAGRSPHERDAFTLRVIPAAQAAAKQREELVLA